jgi:DNA polymerase III gamma/tau subunit
MRDYDEKSYYEIQLDNKQLILVFLAAVTVCVLIFVLGVMIGKGQKEAEIAAATRTQHDLKTVRTPETDTNTPQQAVTDESSSPAAEPVEEKPTPAAVKSVSKSPDKPAVKQAKAEPEKQEQKYAYEDLDKTDQDVDKSNTKSATPAAAPANESTEEDESQANGSTRYTVQVMATSSKPKAEAQLSALRSKGYKPFLDETKSGEISVFKVRVGRFSDTDEAKAMASKIKTDMKLDTWVAVLD